MAKCLILQELEKQPDRWFSVKELAELLNVTTSAVRNKLKVSIKLNWVYHRDVLGNRFYNGKSGRSWELQVKHRDEDELY